MDKKGYLKIAKDYKPSDFTSLVIEDIAYNEGHKLGDKKQTDNRNIKTAIYGLTKSSISETIRLNHRDFGITQYKYTNTKGKKRNEVANDMADEVIKILHAKDADKDTQAIALYFAQKNAELIIDTLNENTNNKFSKYTDTQKMAIIDRLWTHGPKDFSFDSEICKAIRTGSNSAVAAAMLKMPATYQQDNYNARAFYNVDRFLGTNIYPSIDDARKKHTGKSTEKQDKEYAKKMISNLEFADSVFKSTKSIMSYILQNDKQNITQNDTTQIQNQQENIVGTETPVFNPTNNEQVQVQPSVIKTQQNANMAQETASQNNQEGALIDYQNNVGNEQQSNNQGFFGNFVNALDNFTSGVKSYFKNFIGNNNEQQQTNKDINMQ